MHSTCSMALIDARGTVLSKDELIEPRLAGPGRRGEQPAGADRGAAQGARPRPRSDPHRRRARLPVHRRDSRRASGVAASAGSPLRRDEPVAPVSELIGRDTEVGEVVDLVRAHRLVTLTGSRRHRQDAPEPGGGATAAAAGLPTAYGLPSSARCPIPSWCPVTVATALGLTLAAGTFVARAGRGSARPEAGPADPRQLRARDRGGGAHGRGAAARQPAGVRDGHQPRAAARAGGVRLSGALRSTCRRRTPRT